MQEHEVTGRDEGLVCIRLATGEAHKLTDAQYDAFEKTGELPSVDPVPEIVKGPGEHPWSDEQSGKAAEAVGTPAATTEEAQPSQEDTPDPNQS